MRAMSSLPGVALFGPPRCVVCRHRADWLCATCRAAARPPQEDLVIRDVTRAVAPWAYEGGPRSLVLALKLRGLRGAAEPLVDAMVRCSGRSALDPTTITWVPARRRDKARRGFDHAEVLARGVAAGLGGTALPLLERRGHQADQAGLDRAHRLGNLRSAFVAADGVPGSVLLCDDLVTTGATAAACATALRSAGARRVEVLVACRR